METSPHATTNARRPFLLLTYPIPTCPTAFGPIYSRNWPPPCGWNPLPASSARQLGDWASGPTETPLACGSRRVGKGGLSTFVAGGDCKEQQCELPRQLDVISSMCSPRIWTCGRLLPNVLPRPDFVYRLDEHLLTLLFNEFVKTAIHAECHNS